MHANETASKRRCWRLRSIFQTLVGLWAAAVPGCAETPPVDTAEEREPAQTSFVATQLHAEFLSEGATFGDFNQDGEQDIVAGPYWYAGPTFLTRHEIYPAEPFDPKGYSDNFFAFSHDFNRDGWPDVLVVGFPGQEAAWFENPKRTGAHWTRRPAFDGVDTESPAWVDLTGDGEPELVCATQGRLGWLAHDSSAPEATWQFHPLSPDLGFAAFTHGLGVGDVNLDGRQDVIEATAWWEQPPSLDGDPTWIRHEAYLGNGGAQMFAYDVDGDEDNDIITTLNAHGYGIAWFEQTSGGFLSHPISEGPAGPTPLHEPHALHLFDMDGDGLQDIVAGERFWGHVPEGDPDFNASAQLVWFQLQRGANGATYTPHLVHGQSGVGTQVLAGHINKDGLADIVVANKKGAFVFIQTGG